MTRPSHDVPQPTSVEQMATLRLVSAIDDASHWNDAALVDLGPDHLTIHWRPFLYDEHRYFYIHDGTIHMIPRPVNEVVKDSESFQLTVVVDRASIGWVLQGMWSMYLTLHGLNADRYLVGTLGRGQAGFIAHPVTTRRCRLTSSVPSPSHGSGGESPAQDPTDHPVTGGTG